MAVIRGWRAWDWSLEHGRLKSLTTDTLWYDVVDMKAACDLSDLHKHPEWDYIWHRSPSSWDSNYLFYRNPDTGEVTGRPCPCGIYSHKTYEQAKKLVYYTSDKVSRIPNTVLGQVILWGDVYEHEKGYRAEYARIESLVVPRLWPEMARKLQEFYDVPIRIDNDF